MCNDYGNHIPYSDYLAAFSQTRIPVRWPPAAPISNPARTFGQPITRRHPAAGGRNKRVPELRWGFPPARANGAGNQFPLGGRRFSGRPLSGADVALLRIHGDQIAETKWRFTKSDEDWFCFAGLWRPTPDGSGGAFTS